MDNVVETGEILLMNLALILTSECPVDYKRVVLELETFYAKELEDWSGCSGRVHGGFLVGWRKLGTGPALQANAALMRDRTVR